MPVLSFRTAVWALSWFYGARLLRFPGDLPWSDATASMMIDEHYAIAVDASHKLIATTLTGVWTCETVDRYKADLLAAGARLMAVGVDAGHIALLIDTRAFGPQPREVVAYYARVFGERRFQS